LPTRCSCVARYDSGESKRPTGGNARAGLKSDARGNKSVTFWFGGRQFTKSAGTRDPKTAEAVKARVEDTLFRLGKGYLTLPEGADLGDFVVSGGQLTARPGAPVDQRKPITLVDLLGLYNAHFPRGAKERSTVAMEGFHKAHLIRLLGADAAVETMTLPDAQRYANKRSREKYRGKPIPS
jgi:hypothetical protein